MAASANISTGSACCTSSVQLPAVFVSAVKFPVRGGPGPGVKLQQQTDDSVPEERQDRYESGCVGSNQDNGTQYWWMPRRFITALHCTSAALALLVCDNAFDALHHTFMLKCTF